MKTSSAVSLYRYLSIAAALLFLAAPAHAQYKPRPLNDPATGEVYHIEGSAGFWFPGADVTVSSAQFGIQGDTISFKRDLGLQDQHFGDFKVVLRPAKIVKFRFEFIPIKYEQSTQLTKSIVFNGIEYPVNLPVNSTLDWKAYRGSVEFDFVSTNRGFAGVVLDVKYTDVRAEIDTPLPVCKNNVCAPLTEFTHNQLPIPAIGGIGRVYVVPNISITGEVTGFKLPDNLIKDTSGHYVDVDVYGTVNFTNNIGAQVGYRSFDFGYLARTDSGTFTLRGMYLGLVARY